MEAVKSTPINPTQWSKPQGSNSSSDSGTSPMDVEVEYYSRNSGDSLAPEVDKLIKFLSN